MEVKRMENGIKMNERIKELVMQNERIWNLYTIGPVQRAEVEQFVESIVQECELALRPMLRDMVSRGQAFDLIKKHFGVKD